MPAKLLQSLLQSRSFSWLWSGRGGGSNRQKHVNTTRNVEKDLGTIWFAKLSEVNEDSGKEKGNPETGIGGEWSWQNWKYMLNSTLPAVKKNNVKLFFCAVPTNISKDIPRKKCKIFTRKYPQRNSQMKILYQINLKEQHIPQTKKMKRKYLPRNHWREITTKKYLKIIYQRILKETFPAKGLERGISTKNILKTCLPKCVWKQFLYQKLSEEKSMPPKKNWKKHFYGKLSGEKSLQNNFQKKPLPKNIWRKNLLYQKIFKRNLYQKIFEDKNLPKYAWRKILYQTRCEGKLSTKQALNRNPLQTNSERNLYQRVFEEINKYIYIYLYAYQTYSEGESLRKKYLKRNLSPEKNLSKNV